jgi:cytochrome c-type biogenesis protein CcmH/NrfG
VYRIKEEYDRAIADFETALRLEPDHVDAKKWLVEARQAWGY